MNKEKLGQEPAFPIEELQKGDGIQSLEPHLGISKRYYTACMALQGLVANTNTINVNGIRRTQSKAIAETCYELADELLKQEDE